MPQETQRQAAGTEILPAARYIDIPWNGTLNGNYQIFMNVSTVVGNSATSQSVNLPFPTTLTVDMEDLLITGTSPANPTPLLWDPTANNGYPLPLPLSATFTAAYKATGTATVKIYTSDNNVTPIRTLTQPFTTTDGRTIFSWDGTSDPISDGMGGFIPGIMQPRGEYLFKWNVQDNFGVTDSDKSPNLVISTSAIYAKTISDNGTIATYQISYTLTSLDNPIRSASAGQIDIFDPYLTKIFTQALSSTDITPGTHSVTVTMPSTELGPSIFMVSATDADSNLDRGNPGRQRYALQHNNWKVPDKTIAFYYGGGILGGAGVPNTNPQAVGFINGMINLGYHRLPGYTYGGLNLDGDSAYSWRYGDPNVNDIGGTWDNTKPLSSSNKRTGALNVDWNHNKLLRTVLFAGHGSDDGAVLLLRGALGTSPSSSQQTYLVSTQSYYDAQKAGGNTYLSQAQTPTKSMILDSMVYPAIVGQSALGNLDLVVLSGCSQAVSTGTATTLGQEFLILGAQCVALVGAPEQDGNNSGAWIDGVQATGAIQTPGFVGYIGQMNGANPKYTIQQSAARATDDVNAFNQQNGGGIFDEFTNHSTALAVTVIGPKKDAPLVIHN